MTQHLGRLLADIRACRICEGHLEPRPVLHVTASAKLLIVGQAPGMRVHKSGISFNDPSGDRLADRSGSYDDDHFAHLISDVFLGGGGFGLASQHDFA